MLRWSRFPAGFAPHRPSGVVHSYDSAAWRGEEWRMGWDSNPRWACTHGGFQDRCLKPLGHPSVVQLGPLSRLGMRRARHGVNPDGLRQRFVCSLAYWRECRIAVVWCLDNDGHGGPVLWASGGTG